MFLKLGEAEEENMHICGNKHVHPPLGLSFLLSSNVWQPYLCEGHQWNWKVHVAESNRCRVQIAHCLSNLVSVL